ncbi:MAG: hypothetical protein Q4C04_03980 [Clostridia bacterium]|nr:hypothetical protein [Clostridia bacterium]
MKAEKNYKSTKRRFSLKKTRFGPLVTALACLLLFAGFVVLIILYGPLVLNRALGCAPDWSWLIGAQSTPSPTPLISPAPTSDPAKEHPLYSVDLKDEQTEMVIADFQYLADFSIVDGQLFCVAGNYTQDGTAAFVRLVLQDLESNSHTYLALDQNYKSLRFPCINEDYIVYMDAAASGGGRLMAYDRATSESRVLKVVHVGVPRPALWGKYASWVERTGSERDKLYLCDVETGESVTLCIYDNSPFGLSAPCLYDGKLLYADSEGILQLLDLLSGEAQSFDTGLYVHDPKYNGEQIAFLSGNHGSESDLYYFTAERTEPVLLSSNVTDFYLGETFAAYMKNDKVYVVFFSDGVSFCITRNEETAQLLGAGGDFVVWMDTTWREKDIVEYMHITEFDNEG